MKGLLLMWGPRIFSGGTLWKKGLWTGPWLDMSQVILAVWKDVGQLVLDIWEDEKMPLEDMKSECDYCYPEKGGWTKWWFKDRRKLLENFFFLRQNRLNLRNIWTVGVIRQKFPGMGDSDTGRARGTALIRLRAPNTFWGVLPGVVIRDIKMWIMNGTVL